MEWSQEFEEIGAEGVNNGEESHAENNIFEDEDLLAQIFQQDEPVEIPAVQALQAEHVQENHGNNEESNDNTRTIRTDPLPTQYLQQNDSIFSLGGQEFQLNNSGTKRLAVGIASREVPELKIIFKLHDTKNGWFIQFSKKSWDAIIYFSNMIKNHLEFGMFDEIFCDYRITVSTSTFCNRGCVVFTDRLENRIVMMPETFSKMVDLKDEINHAYTGMQKNIKDVTARIKLFMDLSFFNLFKSNNVDNRHNYNWLSLMMNRSSNFEQLNKSVANVWLELGKWKDSQENQGQASTSSAVNDS